MGKGVILLPIAGAGLALLWYGATRGVPTVKAMETLGAPLADPNVIPQHFKHPDNSDAGDKGSEDGNTSNQATYRQLLTAYEVDRKYASDDYQAAKDAMLGIIRQAETACNDFAWNGTWSYKYGALGISGWTELQISQSQSLKNHCLDYVKGVAKSPGNPNIKAPPRAGANSLDQSWLDVAQKIRALQQKVKSARDLLPDLRQKYQVEKKKAEQALAMVNDLKKKIEDLHAQGVY